MRTFERWRHRPGHRGTQPALAVLLALLTIAGCGGMEGRGEGMGSADGSPSDGDPVVVTPGTLAALASPPVQARTTAVVATAPVCADCHSNTSAAGAMRDNANRPIAPFDLWRGSMMANAARDPLWRATVSAEVALRPAAKGAIEATCMRCHSPLLEIENRLQGDGRAPGSRHLAMNGLLGDLARDGASCAGCHRIAPDGLGTAKSFDGHYVVHDDNTIFGPHKDPFAMPMANRTGFTPKASDHVRKSALCGSCHTLETAQLGRDGTPTGAKHHEQSPYLEWRASDYSTEAASPGPAAQDCQGCHMPTRDVDDKPISTRIARRPSGSDFPPIDDRTPYGRHLLVGGNTLLPTILRDQRAALAPEVPAAAFDATIAAARDQLRHHTARLDVVEALRVEAGPDGAPRLRGAIRVHNLAGHKLPTGYPSRRLWLRLRLLDGDDVVLAVGEHDGRGRILGPNGQPLPSESRGGPGLPHAQTLAGSEVALWESVMRGADGKPTFHLLDAGGFWKDDRLLPSGWNAEHPDAAATAPVGTSDDPDFVAGSDTVRLDLPLPAGKKVGSVRATLLFQVVSPRWAEELLAVQTPETLAFAALWQAADVRPEVVDEQSFPVGTK